MAVTPSPLADEWLARQGVDAVLVHHPTAVYRDTPVYGCHTRADRGLPDPTSGHKGGINFAWARLLGLKNIRRFKDLYVLGDWPEPLTGRQARERTTRVINFINTRLGDDTVLTDLPGRRFYRRGEDAPAGKTVCLISGLGGMVIGDARAAWSPEVPNPADPNHSQMLITGELCGDPGIRDEGFESILECGHTLNERVFVWANLIYLRRAFPGLEVVPVPLEMDHWHSDPVLPAETHIMESIKEKKLCQS